MSYARASEAFILLPMQLATNTTIFNNNNNNIPSPYQCKNFNSRVLIPLDRKEEL